MGPKANGHTPGELGAGEPDPSKGALNAKTPPSPPTNQYPGIGLLWGARLVARADALPKKDAATTKAKPTVKTLAIFISRHLLLGAPMLIPSRVAASPFMPHRQCGRNTAPTSQAPKPFTSVVTTALTSLYGNSGLPTAVSGQNNEWFWGPGHPDATTVTAVAPGPVDVTDYAGFLERHFTDVRAVAIIRNTAGTHNQEWDGHLYLCTGLRRPWGQTWGSLRHDS